MELHIVCVLKDAGNWGALDNLPPADHSKFDTWRRSSIKLMFYDSTKQPAFLN